MVFVTDPKTLRVIDADRRMELIRTGGGSDGRQGKKLVGPNFECTFDAYRRVRDASPAERRARPEVLETVVWELSNAGPLIPGLSLRQTYELLGEALLAERLSRRHDEVNWTFCLPNNIGE